MADIIDQLEMEADLEAEKSPSPKIDLKKRTPRTVTATSAKALIPDIKLIDDDSDDPIKKLEEEAEAQEYAKSFGIKPETPKTIPDPKLVAFEEEKDIDPIKALEAEAKIENTFLATEYSKKKGAQVLDKVYEVLDAEENATVKGISKAISSLPGVELKERPFRDYTYKNLLLELGLPDNKKTDTLATVLSIGAVPSTWLTLGESTAAKASRGIVKGLKHGLTEKGLKAATKAASELADARILEIKGAGKPLDQVAENGIRQATLKEVVENMDKNFKDNVKNFDLGGVKIAGVRVLDNQRIKDIADVTGATQALNTLTKATRYLEKTKAGQTFNTRVVDPFSKAIVEPAKELKKDIFKTFKETFVADFGKDKDILDIYDDLARKGRDIELREFAQMQKRFSGLTDEQRLDFGNSAILADKENPTQKVFVKSLKGDPKVQDALDRYYAQGKYKGLKSVPEELSDLLPLLEDQKRPNFFPGIIEEYVQFKLPKKGVAAIKDSGDVDFYRKRKGDHSADYVRDATKALATRRTQIAYVHLQNELYERLLQEGAIKGIGNARKFNSEREALLEGYKKLERPKELEELGLPANKKLESQHKDVYFPEDFVRQYEEQIRDQAGPGGLLGSLNGYTNIWKRSQTLAYPSFHVSNALGNVVLNSLNIGKHALDRNTYNLAYRTLKKDGKNFEFVNDLGEKLTKDDIFKEAYREGLIKQKEFVTDLSGESLSKEAKAVWDGKLQQFNPLSSKFIPSKVGEKLAQTIEDEARLVNYITWRKKGLSPKLAAFEANQTLFDYSKITKNEKALRVVFPFYTFARKNLEAWGKHTIYNPGTTSAALKFIREIGPTEEEYNQMLPNDRNKLILKMGDTLVNGFRMPFEDVWQIMAAPDKEVETRLNPVLKYGLEKLMDKEFFTGRSLKEANYGNEFWDVYRWSKSDKVNPALKETSQKLVKLLKLEPDKKNPKKLTMDPDYRHILTNMPYSRLLSLMGSFAKEDQDLITKAAGVVTGLRPVPLEGSLAKKLDSESAVRQLKDIAVETNTQRALNMYELFGGTEKGKELGKKYKKLLEKARTNAQREEILDRARADYEKYQQMRIEKGLD